RLGDVRPPGLWPGDPRAGGGPHQDRGRPGARGGDPAPLRRDPVTPGRPAGRLAPARVRVPADGTRTGTLHRSARRARAASPPCSPPAAPVRGAPPGGAAAGSG